MTRPTIHLYTPAEADLVIKKGVTKTVALCKWLPGGTVYVWQPGDVAKMQIRSAPISQGGEVLAEFSTNGLAPKLFFDPSDNFLKWRLEKLTTAAWEWSSGYYDIDVAFASGDELTLLTGLLQAQLEITS